MVASGTNALRQRSKPPSHPEWVKRHDGGHDRVTDQALVARAQTGFVSAVHKDELGGFIANLAAMDELIDFAAVVSQIDATCRIAGRDLPVQGLRAQSLLVIPRHQNPPLCPALQRKAAPRRWPALLGTGQKYPRSLWL